MSEELRKVAVRLDKVQDAVGELAFEAATPRTARFHDLQQLDRATQEVAAIATFLETLSSDLPDEWLADPKRASLAVDLHELAAVLGRSGALAPSAASEHECELFD